MILCGLKCGWKLRNVTTKTQRNYLFAPSNTTYATQWYATVNGDYVGLGASTEECFIAGYFNTASAINAINFKCSSGNFDGIVSLYGISKT